MVIAFTHVDGLELDRDPDQSDKEKVARQAEGAGEYGVG